MELPIRRQIRGFDGKGSIFLLRHERARDRKHIPLASTVLLNRFTRPRAESLYWARGCLVVGDGVVRRNIQENTRCNDSALQSTAGNANKDARGNSKGTEDASYVWVSKNLSAR